MKLDDVKINPDNPRFIKDFRFSKLVESLRTFPEMMFLRPIVVDEGNIALGGNMRLNGLKTVLKEPSEKDHQIWQRIRETGSIPDEWVKSAPGLTPDQKREFIVKDNVNFGEWDFDQLSNEWDESPLDQWGLDIPGFDPKVFTENDEQPKGYGENLWFINIQCGTEDQCMELYERFISEGLSVKIVT